MDFRKTETVIFDFDGTLVDTFEFTLKVVNGYIAKFGMREWDIEKMRNQQEKLMGSGFRRVVKYPLKPFFNVISRKIQKETLRHVAEFKIDPGLVSFFNHLENEGVQMGIVTNNLVELVSRFLEKEGLRDKFDFIQSGRYFAKHSALKKAGREYNLDFRKTIYVGDEVRDIIACRKVDLPVISVGWGLDSEKWLNKNNPDFFVNKVSELKDLFE